MNNRVAIAGLFHARHHDRGGRLVWRRSIQNGVTLAGADYLLGAAFANLAKVTVWRIGLISAAGYTALAPTDTHALHPTWGEYAGVSGSRPVWASSPATGGTVSPAASAVIPISADGSIRGVFLADRSPVGDVSSGGLLYCTAAAAEDLPVTAGGTVTVGYYVFARN